MASRGNDANACYYFSLCFLVVIIILPTLIFLTIICAIHHRPYFVNLDVNGVQSNFTTTSTTNDTLNYNLDLSISLHNPNNKYHIHHHKIEATAFYKSPANNALIGGSVVNLNSFSQKPKSNTVITPSFEGVINLGTDHEVGNLVVKLNLRNKYQTRFVGWEAMSEFECHLKIIPSINGQSFETTTEACKVIYDRLYRVPKPLKVYFFFLVLLLPTPGAFIRSESECKGVIQFLCSCLAAAATIWYYVIS